MDKEKKPYKPHRLVRAKRCGTPVVVCMMHECYRIWVEPVTLYEIGSCEGREFTWKDANES